MSKSYLFNQETQKIELHFSKEEYQALSADLKSELKSSYLFSGKAQAWVSRSTNNHYSAIRTAEKLGFTEKEVIGERLSYAEQIERQVGKAEARAERYEQYADNAEQRAENLQSELNSFHGDVAFFTQPIIKGHSGSEAFAKRRERIFDRYRKGFDEYRKSEYFIDKARTAEETANMSKFKDRTYLNNRIKECNKNIKVYEKNIIWAEENNKQEAIERNLDRLEYEMDKLAYLENCLDELGKTYDKDNLKVGYEVKVRGTWEKIIKLNRTTAEVQPLEERIKMFISKRDYTEIQDVRIPEYFKDVKEELENPYSENDIVCCYGYGGNRIIDAFQVIKVTAKSITIQRINLDSNKKPISSGYTTDKPERKGISKNKYNGLIQAYYDDRALYIYKEDNSEIAI